MTKIERTHTFDLDLDAAIESLAMRLGQDDSQVVGDILRKDPEIAKLLEDIHTMPDIPDHVPELSSEIQT